MKKQFPVSDSVKPTPARSPLFGRDLPDFRWKAPRYVLALTPPHHSHALALRNPPRTFIGDRFGCSQQRLLQLFKPVVGYGVACFHHQALAAPLRGEPESAIFVMGSQRQTDRSDQSVR